MSVAAYVPCYNGAAWLGECLEALLGQRRPADTVAVIDDGSTDASATIARNFAPRVQLIQHDRNRGLAVARNTALAQLPDPLIASVDADVRVEPDWLGELLRGLDSPRTAVVGGCLEEARTERIADRWRAAHMAQHAGAFPLVNPPTLPGANTLVRAAIVRDLGGYDESFRTNYEDGDLQHRLIARGYRCRYQPFAHAWHLRTDTVSSVLRTYWGWLRPPFDRQGAFTSLEGLATKAAAQADLARRALWEDFSDGRGALSYVSLLVAVVFPLADAAYAAALADARGDSAAAGAYRGWGGQWLARLRPAVVPYSAPLSASIAADVDALAWWPRTPTGVVEAPVVGLQSHTSTLSEFFSRLPRAWWPALERAREAVAQEEGWLDTLSLSQVQRPPSQPPPAGAPHIPPSQPPPAGGRSLGTRQGRAGEGETPSALPAAPWESAVAYAQTNVEGVLALIGHGAFTVGEEAFGGPPEVLLVTHEAPSPEQVWRWQVAARRATGAPRLVVRALASHRIGWLPPGLLQQSLLATGVLLWGDPAALAAVPSWRPAQLDPRLALDELDAADAALAAGNQPWTRSLAAGALLLARRAYTARAAERTTAVRRAWPEAPNLDALSASEALAASRRLIEPWLFAWEPGWTVAGEPTSPARATYERLRQLATSRT